MIGALAPAIPEAAVGAANGANTTAVFFGHDPRHDRDYVYLETLGGGFGGRFTKDGKDGVQVHITNTSNLPVESIEMEYPLLVESYGFVEDSGGAGKYRGGLGPAPRGAPGRPHHDVFRPGRALREPAVGHVRRRQRRHRQVREARGRRRSAAADQAGEPLSDGRRGHRGRDAGRGRLRQASRARQGRDRERFRVGQVQPRLHQEELRRGAEERMSYDAIVIGAGISGAATAYHLRKAGAKTLLIERGEPASGGTGKSAAIIRQSYSTPLLVRLARASITMFENAKAELGRTRASCRTAIASSSRRTCWRARRRTSRCRRASASSTNGRRGRAFPQHLPEINPEGIAGIVYEPHGGYADPVQATEAYVEAFKNLGGEFRARTPVRRLLREGDRITGVELDNGEVSANHVVNAAGPWAKPLAESAGLDLPLRSVREQDTVWQVPAGRAVPKTSISMGVDATLLPPARPGPLHHRARLSEGVLRRRSLQLQNQRR